MCCSKTICKCLLFIFNIGFFLFGALSLAIGIFVLVDEDQLIKTVGRIPGASTYNTEEVLNEVGFLETAAIVLIAVGAFVFIIAICGLCGGIKEIKCLLMIYAVVVCMILILEISAGVVGYFYRDRVRTYLMDFLTDLIENKYYGPILLANNIPMLNSMDTLGASAGIDLLQVKLECCGANNYTDFDAARLNNWDDSYNITVNGNTYEVFDAVVPISCCKFNNPSAWPANMENLEFVDIQGCLEYGYENSTNTASCYTETKALLEKYSIYLIGVGIAIGLVQLLGVIASCALIKIIKKESNDVI